MASVDCLFVIGSFAPGLAHHSKLEPFAVSAEDACAVGSVYRSPSGLVTFSSPGSQRIWGSLVRLRSPDLAFAFLDAFHGVAPLQPERSLFARTEVGVETEDAGQAGGRAFQVAAVYQLNPFRLSPGTQPLADGDWRRSLIERPPLFDRLTEKQRAYVLKLSSVGSRTIVPIDLKLYRELMSLELVADKGRRLALTTLGQEVARFIK